MSCPRPFALLVLAALLALPSCDKDQKPLPAVPGNPAPPFTLRDPDGTALRLADFEGKVVILDFWATWCKPCEETTREFEALHRKYGAKGAVFIGISLDKGGGAAQKVKDFAARHGLSYRLLMDDGRTSAAYAVVRIPDTFVLDKNHYIRKNYPGYRKDLARMIASDIEGAE